MLTWYGLGRFFLEPLREAPDLSAGRVRINQCVAAALVLGAGGALLARILDREWRPPTAARDRLCSLSGPTGFLTVGAQDRKLARALTGPKTCRPLHQARAIPAAKRPRARDMAITGH